MAEFSLASANEEAKRRLVRSLQGRGAHHALSDAVRDFPDALMNTRPPHVPYTFWHMIEHIRFCQWDILKYVQDPGHTSPPWPRGYWPDPDAEADRAKWDRSIEEYSADVDAFVALVQAADCNVLQPVKHNDGRSIMGSVLVVVDHTSYHLGEFILGRQMLGAWKSELE